MRLLPLSHRATARRIALIDAYQFPSSVRLRFTSEHHSLSTEDVRTVEAGLRQWFRLAARHPKANLSMPSVVVDDMWHELVLHTRDYAEFCAAALPHFLHHTPETAVSTQGAAANRGSGLGLTFRLAREDETGAPGSLPLLFRVDREVGVTGGRRYLADCGGRGQCHELPGVLCLQHVAGEGWGNGGRWDRNRTTQAGNYPSEGGGGGVGCGRGRLWGRRALNRHLAGRFRRVALERRGWADHPGDSGHTPVICG